MYKVFGVTINVAIPEKKAKYHTICSFNICSLGFCGFTSLAITAGSWMEESIKITIVKFDKKQPNIVITHILKML